jgi:signal peptidase I
MTELQGSLHDFELRVLLRFLATQRSSGYLHISRSGLNGELLLDNGQVVGAAAGEQRGIAAVDLIALVLADGYFIYTDGPRTSDATVATNDVRLLDIDSRIAELARRGSLLLPSVPRLTEIRRESGEERIALSRFELSMLFDVDEHRTVEDLVRERDTLQVLPCLMRLGDLGLITLEPSDARPPEAGSKTNVVAEHATTFESGQGRVLEHAVAPPVPPPRIFRLAWRVLPLALITALFVVAIRLVIQTIYVEGQSMLPGLKEGDLLLVNRTAYLFQAPERGDIIAFQSPTTPDTELLKRVVALPGERVRIEQGTVLVDDRPLTEPYAAPGVAEGEPYPASDWASVVPSDSYFVLGDNRAVSLDSRLGWFVSANQIVGRAWLTYWPPRAFGVLEQAGSGAVAPPTAAVSVETSSLEAAAPAERSDSTAVVAEVPAPTSTLQPITLQTVLDGDVALQPGWPSHRSGTAWLENGEYRLFAREAGRFVGLAAPVADRYADVVVSAEFHKAAGPAGGGYGLIVRDQEPAWRRDGVYQGGRFYIAAASDVGDVGLWQREEDHWVDLVPWRSSVAVRKGTASNALTLRAVGPSLTFLVNGVEVINLRDSVLPEGGVGVFAGGDLNNVVLERFNIQLPTTPVTR